MTWRNSSVRRGRDIEDCYLLKDQVDWAEREGNDKAAKHDERTLNVAKIHVCAVTGVGESSEGMDTGLGISKEPSTAKAEMRSERAGSRRKEEQKGQLRESAQREVREEDSTDHHCWKS
jgi:hypothetical protein